MSCGNEFETWALDENGNDVPGTGRRYLPADRCKSERLGLRCVGVDGHDGRHWRYDELGWYSWWRNDATDEPDEIAGGRTPPGHARYVHPSDRFAETHVAHGRCEAIKEAPEANDTL